MRIQVKICGIKDPAALEAAADADWIGFNFYPPSPRFVTPAQAAVLSAAHPGGPARVGLFVEPTDAEVEAALGLLPLDVLQIYADPDRAAVIRRRFGVTVWRCVGLASPADLPGDLGIDGYLLDAKPPPGAALPGGNAARFDWSMLRHWIAPKPWLLAGGLSAGNVAEAIETSGATAVDVSSGVERARGVKDPAQIRAFIASARSRVPA